VNYLSASSVVIEHPQNNEFFKAHHRYHERKEYPRYEIQKLVPHSQSQEMAKASVVRLCHHARRLPERTQDTLAEAPEPFHRHWLIVALLVLIAYLVMLELVRMDTIELQAVGPVVSTCGTSWACSGLTI